MTPIKIIDEFYKPGSKAHEIISLHGQLVAKKALKAAKRVKHLNPDMNFIEEAAILHDIGIFMTDAPGIGCFGKHPYIAHGVLGRGLLEEKGITQHALVCERHVGVGIDVKAIKAGHLPLPLRDMIPVTIEEQIICFADKFFSKDPDKVSKEKSIEDILGQLGKYGKNQVERFKSWAKMFGES
jgi:uncharacterized protein